MTMHDIDAGASARPEREALTLRYAARKPLFDQADTSHHIYEITSGSVMIFKLMTDVGRLSCQRPQRADRPCCRLTPRRRVKGPAVVPIPAEPRRRCRDLPGQRSA